MRLLLALASFLLVACSSSGSDTSGVVASLTGTGGCGSIQFQAWAQDGTARLNLGVQLDAFSGPRTQTFTANDLSLATVTVGHELQTEACPDYSTPGTTIDHTFHVTAGSVNVDLEAAPEDDGYPAASAIIDGLELESDDGATLTIDHFEILDATVGWLAG